MKLEDFKIILNDNKYTTLQAIEQIAKITKKALELHNNTKAIDDDFVDNFDDEDFAFAESTKNNEPYFSKHMTEIVSELFALTSAMNIDSFENNFLEKYETIIAQSGAETAVYHSVIAQKRNTLGQYIDPLEMIKTAVFTPHSVTQVSIQHIAQAIKECA